MLHDMNGEVSANPVGPKPDLSPEEAKASVLDFINQMANLKATAGIHKPVLKTLEELGVPVITKMIEFNGEEQKCLVIPVSDLLLKEYEVITGYNASSIMGSQNATATHAPVRYDYNNQTGN